MKFQVLATIFILSILNCAGQSEKVQVLPLNEDEIIKKYLKNGAWNHSYLTKEWDEWINKGLKEDSTVEYLWQQKAMPFWKTKKYSLAISYYEKAVEFNRKRYLGRFGFLKCIFAKDYNGALKDLISYKNEFGSRHEQDHSLEFYMGICFLQINQYEKALNVLKEQNSKEETQHGNEWVHYLDRYYLAITYYELGKYVKAISEFDKVLKDYPRFSDAQYYKSLCLNRLDKKEEAKMLMKEGKSNFKKGYTFNEDSSKYEEYPYQITWQWMVTESIME